MKNNIRLSVFFAAIAALVVATGLGLLRIRRTA